MEGLTVSEEGRLKTLAAVAAACLGGLLVQPLFAPPDIASVASKPTPTVQTKKADPAPAPAPKVEPTPGKRTSILSVALRKLVVVGEKRGQLDIHLQLAGFCGDDTTWSAGQQQQ